MNMEQVYENKIIELIVLNCPLEVSQNLVDLDLKLIDDLGYDSIALINLLVDVEEEFKFESEDMEESLSAFETIGSFIEFVKNNMN